MRQKLTATLKLTIDLSRQHKSHTKNTQGRPKHTNSVHVTASNTKPQEDYLGASGRGVERLQHVASASLDHTERGARVETWRPRAYLHPTLTI